MSKSDGDSCSEKVERANKVFELYKKFENNNSNSNKLELTKVPVNCIDYIPLFRFESLGFRNKVSASKRASIYALLMTLILMVLLILLSELFILAGYDLCGKSNAVDFMTVFVIIFAGISAGERLNVYNKWAYLASFFNTVNSFDEKDRRKIFHNLGCLGHDLVTMEMWAHPSFQSVFREIVVLAILGENMDEPEKAVALANNLDREISYDKAKTLISKLIHQFGPL